MIAPIIDSVAVATIVASTVVYYRRTDIELAKGALLLGGGLLTLPYAIATVYGWSRIARCPSQRR